MRRAAASSRPAVCPHETQPDRGNNRGEVREAGKAASRCSVHCKSDATHKLNKGECTPADVAVSLIADLAGKIATMVESSNWPRGHIVLAGGLVQNDLFVKELRTLLAGSEIDILGESVCLEAFGAAVAAKETGKEGVPSVDKWLHDEPRTRFDELRPLSDFTSKVKRMTENSFRPVTPETELILGVDAGSTTTKAVLLGRKSGELVASTYLRTYGNPVKAASECLAELKIQLAAAGAADCRIIQSAATGSGRDLVSIFLDNSLSFNEILAHARAAKEAVPDVDTIFEIGGQDAKFIALENGVPVDYAMNDGCSAGTGSFLEEAAVSDMRVTLEEIGPLALDSQHPVAFDERCAAFINSEVRLALEQGVPKGDVLAGLVYAITDNYLSRVAGARNIGHTILLQGGVALNAALAPAVAAMTGTDVHVPPHPELMGCIGAAFMAGDLLLAGTAPELDGNIASFGRTEKNVKGTFVCGGCKNRCEITRIALGDTIYPFGGLCSKWEMARRPDALRAKEGKDLLNIRQDMMFRGFAPLRPEKPRGRIGLPLALTTYELFPFYAKLLTSLDYEVVLSEPGAGNRRTYAPACYPGEIAHAAMDDLLSREVDYIFLPYLREFDIPAGHRHAYLCPAVQDIPAVIKSFFEGDSDKFLTPEIGLSEHLLGTSGSEIVRMAERLGADAGQAGKAFRSALDYQGEFEKKYRENIRRELENIEGPAVILAGRPYAAFAPEVNLSISRKIASRGFTVIPADGLPFEPLPDNDDVWHFTQRTFAAVEYARRHDNCYVCILSCYSCGPDAIMHHRLRRETEGKPFCFLEIDSLTAHAGIETRIGAFLDIIEERRQRALTPLRTEQPQLPAHTERKNGRLMVVDSQGNYLPFDDKRIVHVLLTDLPGVTSEMFVSIYRTVNRNVRVTPRMDYETLQKARRVCSGRECLPFLAMMGKVVSTWKIGLKER